LLLVLLHPILLVAQAVQQKISVGHFSGAVFLARQRDPLTSLRHIAC